MTDSVMEWVERVAHIPTDGLEDPPDICVIELGGTVGDIESMPFIEALRQFQFRVGPENMCFLHVSLVPVIGVVGEEKTKPTQHSVQNLRAVGLAADFLVCRSSKPLSAATKNKLACFCQVSPEVRSCPPLPSPARATADLTRGGPDTWPDTWLA